MTAAAEINKGACMLADLTAILPPPPNPTHAVGDWACVEQDLGVELPSDYKAILQTYGYGQFCDNLSVVNPFVGKPLKSTIGAIVRQWQQISEICAVEYPFFPDHGGLLPCAVNINGHYVSWKTEGRPDAWEIVVWDSSEPKYVSSTGPLSNLLHDVLTRARSLTSLLLPDLANEPGKSPWFTQWQMNAGTGVAKPLSSS